MKPYYQDDLVTLYHGDCREITAWLDADVLVTDPPYGTNWRRSSTWTNQDGQGGRRGHKGIANDLTTEARDDTLALWGERPAVVFGDLLRPQPPCAVHVLIYAKSNNAGVRNARAGRRRDVEGIYLCGKWPTGVGGATSVLRSGGQVAGPLGIGLRAGHPHAKPQDLMEELITLREGSIADPFAGSGSTLVAAKALGRKAIGVEVDERYCETAAKRLAQDTLFGAAS